MKTILNSIVVIFFLILTSLAIAQPSISNQETKTVVLSIPGMTCATCPITVKKALEKLPGVVQVKSHFKNKTVVVRYQPNQVSPKDLLDATKNVGYPSSINTDQDKG